MDFKLVYNPVSGKGKGKKKALLLEAELNRRGHEVSRLETTADPTLFSQTHGDKAHKGTVVVIGGDGTLNYAVNALPNQRTFAFLGMGTANVVSIEFGIPKRIKPFADMLEAGHKVVIYPGISRSGRRFLMMYSAGIDAYVLGSVSQRLKNVLGKMAFVPAALKAARRYAYPQLEIETDDGRRFRGFFVLAARMRHYGGPIAAAPEADSSGNHYVVIIQKRPGLSAGLGFFSKLLRGYRLNDPISLRHAEVVHCNALQVRNLSEEVPGQLDGDVFPSPIESMTIDETPIELVIPRKGGPLPGVR